MIYLFEKIVEINLLFDFYGKLLTEKQQKVVRLYYYNDMSLSEIGDELGISRQGIYDHLQRSENLLRNYENKLKLLEKYTYIKYEFDKLLDFINDREINEKEKAVIKTRIKELRKSI